MTNFPHISSMCWTFFVCFFTLFGHSVLGGSVLPKGLMHNLIMWFSVSTAQTLKFPKLIFLMM